MPTPAILSGQMDPPPIKPVAELNFAEGGYKLYDEDTTMDTLVLNASGPASDIAPIANRGVFLHDNTDNTPSEFPPSLIGATALKDALTNAITSSGGMTVVAEIETDYEFSDFLLDVPLVYVAKQDIFDDAATEDFWDVAEWLTYELSTTPTGIMTESFAYKTESTSNSQDYFASSPYATSGHRRHRFASTWCFDRGSAAAPNRYRGGNSIDGTPQNVPTPFGSSPNPMTPRDIAHDLRHILPIHTIHICGVGADISRNPDGDIGWWWWPHNVYLRYIAFYAARPSWSLPILSKQPHQMLRVNQFYAEVIHDPVP